VVVISTMRTLDYDSDYDNDETQPSEFPQ